MNYISELRKLVGHRPLAATAAMCIIYDETNRTILFEKRTDNGTWCVPGGALELGETIEEGLAREVKEETNLDFTDPEFFTVKANVHMKYPNGDEVYYTDIVYIIKKFTGELKHDSESSELKWFPVDDLPDGIIETQIEYITDFVKNIKSV